MNGSTRINLLRSNTGTPGMSLDSPSVSTNREIIVATSMATFGWFDTSADGGKSLRLGVVLVGDTGFEPVTSSVSGKRAPTAPIARGGDGI